MLPRRRTVHIGRGGAALFLAAFVLAAPAHAVVGGKKVSARDTPWFATLNGCGGTLVAPDRVVTAAHCVLAITPQELRGIRVGGVKRNGVRFAMHPDWRRANGDNVLDDVAIIQLDQPVPNVVPAALGGEAPKRAIVLGRGASRANQTGFGVLREATLKTVSDSACKRIYRRARGNGGERFNGARMSARSTSTGARRSPRRASATAAARSIPAPSSSPCSSASSASAARAVAPTGSRPSSP